MKIFLYELYKLFKNKAVTTVFLLLFAVNTVFACLYTPVEGVPDKALIEMNRRFDSADEADKGLVMLTTGNDFIPDNMLNPILPSADMERDLSSILNYTEKIEEIIDTAEKHSNLSAFVKKNSFSYRNNLAVIEAFKAVEEVKPSYYLPYSTDLFIKSNITDIMMFFIVLTAAIDSVWNDKLRGVTALIHTTKEGRTKTAASKLLSVFAFTFAGISALYVVPLLIGGARFGFGDLSRPIQSIADFSLSTLNISVGGYLLLHISVKLTAFFVIAVFIMILCSVFKNIITSFAATGAAVALFTAFYAGTGDTSSYAALKFLNPVCLIQPQQIFGRYLNLNLFEYPINTATACMTLLTVLFIAVSVAFLLIYIFSLPYEASKIHLNVIKNIKMHFKPSASLFRNELYKTFIADKCLPIILVLCLFGIYRYSILSLPYNVDEAAYNSYINIIGGEVDEDTLKFIEEEDRIFSEYQEKYDLYDLSGGNADDDEIEQIRRKLNYKNGFEIVKKRAEYIYHNPEKHLQLIYETGYNELFSVKCFSSDLLHSLIATAALAVCVSSIYAVDNQKKLKNVIRTAVNGRGKLFLYRTICCLIISTVIFAAVFLPQFIFVLNNCGFYYLDAPLQSITALTDFESGLTVLEYMILVYAARLISLTAVSVIMLCISRVCANIPAALFANLIIFALPISLGLFSDKLSGVWFTPYLSGNGVRYATTANMVLTIMLTVLCITLFVFIQRDTLGKRGNLYKFQLKK